MYRYYWYLTVGTLKNYINGFPTFFSAALELLLLPVDPLLAFDGSALNVIGVISARPK